MSTTSAYGPGNRMVPNLLAHRIQPRRRARGSLRRRFPQPIKATAHGIIDYGFCALMTAGPALAGVSPRLRALSWAVAATQGTINALTDHPVALRRMIPLRVHGRLELAAAPAVVALPPLTGAVADRRSRSAWLAVLALLAANYALTDYEAPADS